MAKTEVDVAQAKSSYRKAKEIGHRREEAKWANVIADIYKNRGEYCQALEWLRIDYKISKECLLQKDILPTCQSIGELYLRLHDYSNALLYQKEHLQRAQDSDDLIEQQRATTQLGRTYHELFFKKEDHSALHKARKYFKSAMCLARKLKENPPDSKSSFLKEYVDAYNNVGMLEMDLDNLYEAEKILIQGLQICDEEEVNENDDGRSRLHHNLGYVYTQLRLWDKAREHIEKDILICKNIGHRQGEAKGYINLGELYCKKQKFEQALCSYQKALELAHSMEDEDALAIQIQDNIKVVKEFIKVMEDIKVEEQNLKKLKRKLNMAKGTSGERKSLRQLIACLDRLMEKTMVVSAWSKHKEYAEMKKTIAAELCDKEKLGDAYLAVGESYQKLRKFEEARKWYTKSLELYEVIGNLEGQAIVKINMGDILDSEGDWKGALETFKEGYRIAVEANKIPLQISALENMHYSNMMRFDDVEEARRLKHEIDYLQTLVNSEQTLYNVTGDSCSETETEGNDSSSRNRSEDDESSLNSRLLHPGKLVSSIEDAEIDQPLSSLLRCNKLRKTEHDRDRSGKLSSRTSRSSPVSLLKASGSPPRTAGRKRTRLVLSDDEDDLECSNTMLANPVEDIVTSNDFVKGRSEIPGVASDLQKLTPDGNSCNPVNLEESTCSFKSGPCEEAAGTDLKFPADKCCIRMKVEDVPVCIEALSSTPHGELDVEVLKVQAACSYFLQLSSHRRSKGLLPILGTLKLKGKVLSSTDSLEILVSDTLAGNWIEASVNGWVQKRLIKMYVDCCQKSSELPNMKLLMKLYNLEVSEDEVILSDCELQDKSVEPLLDALGAHKTIAMLDLSHNMLGNATMEKLLDKLALSDQKYGAFVLDMHCNTFGPTSLFQICECPVLLNRLEVLNISGNRLTDACATYLSAILHNCKALYSLNIERCSITSRTIQTVADALDSGCVLSQLSVGYNNPISGSSLAYLLGKLAKLERFSELSLSGLKLNRLALDSICQLAQASSLSGLVLGETNMGCDGALQLTKSLFHDTSELVKFNLSYCLLAPAYFEILKNHTTAFCNILELNLSGNPIMLQGGVALSALLADPQCCVRNLFLSKCGLGLSGVIRILKSLAENESLDEVSLAGNIEQVPCQFMETEISDKKISEALVSENSAVNVHGVVLAETCQNDELREDIPYDQLEAADSYDNDLKVEHPDSGLADGASSRGNVNAVQSENHFLDELCSAISNAKHLKLLDLSDNGFSAQVADTFYNAWSSVRNAASPRRHIKGQILHLSVRGKICCGVKPCCRRD